MREYEWGRERVQRGEIERQNIHRNYEEGRERVQRGEIERQKHTQKL